MLSQKLLDEIMAEMEHLPEMPAVAIQVNRLLDDPETPAAEIAEVIMKDPSMTSKLLRLCNSAEYGFSRKIGTISEAVTIIGQKELKKLVLTILSHGMLHRPVEGYALEKGALWDNALTCAMYARYLAKKFDFSNVELAFIAALLRDIGKIALDHHLNGRHVDLEEHAKSEKCSFSEAEEQLIGLSHTYLGAQFAIRWNLPDSLVRSIEYHHAPSQLPEETNSEDIRLVSLIHLADTLTMMAGTGVGVDGLMYPLDVSILITLNISATDGTLDHLYAEVLELREDIDQLLVVFEGKN
jgi:putative nucleotidyltransferase with HDIG domain